MGGSLKDVCAFNSDLRQAFGHQLWLVQCGDTPANAKAGEVPGTMKLVEDDGGDTYRIVYTIKLSNAVYVLHAFKKKSNSGIATPEKDLSLIRDRLKRAVELDQRQAERRNHD